MERIRQLEADRSERREKVAEILGAASKDKRALTDEERGQADALQTELDRIEATIALERKRAEWDRTSAPASPDTPAAPAAAAPGNDWAPAADVKANPLAGFGEFLQAVAASYKHGRITDARLVPEAAATGMNTAVPSEGGFLVRTQWAANLLARAEEAAQLLPLCTRIPIGEGNDGLEAPYIEETSRATGSRWGGVRVYRRAEADTVTASKPKLGRLELRLEDLMGISYVTDRAMRDASALAEITAKSFASEFAFAIDDEIFRGTGVGQCLGLYPAGVLGVATVQQTKESGPQTADTVVAANVQKMFARMPARLVGGAVWLINNEVWPQLFGMNQSNMPVFMPGTSLANAPYGMLLGRPIKPIEQASAIGDLGDITFANLGEYLIIEKGGLQTAESMHVRFLYGENVFRFTYSINGTPAWKAALTPYKGASTLSPFVGLEAR